MPNDGVGCLQDVQWAFGSIGCFSTFMLGNVYVFQFYDAAKREIDGVKDGEFGVLRKWLNDKIYVHGKRYRAGELCEVVTGRNLSAGLMRKSMESKFEEFISVRGDKSRGKGEVADEGKRGYN